MSLAAGLWLIVAVPAQAAEQVVAQYTTPTTTWMPANGSQMLAQTFTAQSTGQLDRVELPLGGMWNASGKIYIVPAGSSVTDQPSAAAGPSYSSYSGMMSCCAFYGSFAIAPAFQVTAGGHYAIVVVPNIGTSITWGVVNDTYPGGQVWMGSQPSSWSNLPNMVFDFSAFALGGSAPTPNVAPTVTRAKADAPVTEGVAPSNSGTFADSDGDTVHLSASSGTLNYTPASSGNWTWTGPATDEGPSQTITISADDGKGGTAQTTFTTETTDSTPAVAGLQVSAGLVFVAQEPLTFTGTYTDAGAAVDTYYTATWSFGDKTSSTGTTPAGLTATHAYSASGTYTATLAVADDDGTTGSATTTVTVLTPAQAIGKIGAYLQSLGGLDAGQKTSLQAKLNAAADSYQRGDTAVACNQLNAFVNEVGAQQQAGRLTTAEATTLTDAARLTQRSMGCFRALVEFLNGL